MLEEFRDVKGYEGVYQVSNFGRVKSLSRFKKNGINTKQLLKERILKHGFNKGGYPIVSLGKNLKFKTKQVHQLVASAFLNHTPNGYKGLIVDHINNIKTDNRLENLQLTTARHNVSKDQKIKTSKYIGVSFCKRTGLWVSSIQINGKNIFLGRYKTEEIARDTYNLKLKQTKKWI